MSEHVYVMYTPYIDHKTAHIIGRSADRGTVVAKIVDGTLHYGLSICSENDTFNRATGRLSAVKRMEEGYGKIPIDTFGKRAPLGERAIVYTFLRSIVESIDEDVNKYKRRLEEFNKKRREKLLHQQPIS